MHGSGDLARPDRAGLVESTVWIYPVLLGPGKRLFADGVRPGALRMLSCTTMSSGVIIAT